MDFTAKIIANFLNAEIIGNPEVIVNNISKIEEGQEGTLSFLANPKYLKYLYSTNSSIVLISKNLVPNQKVKPTLIVVEDAYQAFAKLLNLYNSFVTNKSGIEEYAYISKSATIGENVYIGAFSYIGENVIIGKNVQIYPQVYLGDNVVIGDNTIIYPGVKIYKDCKIGSNCIIHAGVVIGSDGFGFALSENGSYMKIPQIGNVIIEDNVEIGANVTIDRATMGSTIIHKGVKLDNLIQIAHNVEIGENTVVAAQSGIAGSTKIGKNCKIAAQVGIVGHIKIANNVIIGAQSGVTHDIKEEGTAILGTPARNFNDKKREYVVSAKLPELYKKIINLEREIENLKKRI